ncbi:hypothetical protein D1B33_14990 [Lysinibacillus yapensis]|uniref:Uncharacterized protein n=1 Tax=Ureibacillus yapensis TaxID=2304605 RepID=A0A396S4M0_9BACL|nr:hypothetical protein [Lysinibacillus yapensis]RHW34096.1 hypothetical protein D1B33_14990 [Lysinibacillus yapensis]
MDFLFYITIIVGLYLICYGYVKKQENEVKKKEIELEEKKIELEMKKLEVSKNYYKESERQ